jgi:Protein of unknown function (DUF2934)
MIMIKGASHKTPRRSPRISKDKARDLIGKKAYELFEKRGREHGHDLDDWLEAEKLVKTRKKS